jgi:hypothetical protein
MESNGASKDTPAREGIRAFEVKLVPFLYESFAIPPLVNTVVEIRIQDFHRCVAMKIMPKVQISRLPSVMRMQPSGCEEYASYAKQHKYHEWRKVVQWVKLTRTELGCE